jgi:hypothetical protein
MPQYTNSSTTVPDGATVNAILDTASNTVTYTVTNAKGFTATVTLPVSQDPQSVTTTNNIKKQLTAQNGGSGLGLAINGFGDSLNATWGNVTTQAKTAEATSEATGNPPPAESAAIPVAAADNPNPTPAPPTTPIENATTPATGQTAADAAFQEANASPQQFIDPNSDPNTSIGADVQTPANQQTINPNSDPNTNIGADIQTIENAGPVYINDTYVTAQIEAAAAEGAANFAPNPNPTEQDVINAYGGMQGLQASVENARAQQITQDAENAKTKGDWRVRLSLAPSAGYLYKAANPGILGPLQKTDGVIFPYTPSIQVSYAAHYDQQELIHSNYKIYQYKSSGVDQVTITCDFTAQDNEEANYMLAVIHFFRSVTKMFYGQDQNPSPGTPPPLCYLSGMGDFQFDKHPLLISSFNYTLPNEVDYIRASSPTLLSGVSSSGYDNGTRNRDTTASQVRLNDLNPGATESPPAWKNQATNTQPTYVPTKIQLSITAYPVVTRNDISNNFSLKKYATGALLQGSKNPGGGGIW